jgi:hypothetical protein
MEFLVLNTYINLIIVINKINWFATWVVDAYFTGFKIWSRLSYRGGAAKICFKIRYYKTQTFIPN